jgi:hypothetical protein
MMMRRLFAALLLVFVVVLSAMPARAGAQASEDVPLSDNTAYVYLDALLARGALQSLSALERPYNLREIVHGLQTEVPANPSRAVRGYIKGLERALAKYDVQQLLSPQPRRDNALSWQIGGDVGGTFQTSSIRDLMHANSTHGGFADVGLQGAFAVGPVTAVIHEVLQGQLNADPEYHEPGILRSDAVRTQEGYIDARWPFAEVFIGREDRNWGPTSTQGLLLGDYAFSYDHFYLKVGVPQLHWQFLTTRLNNELSADTTFERYFVIHRLGTHIGHFEAGVEESVVYGGAGDSYDFHYLNPFNVYTFSQLNEEQGGVGANKNYAIEAAYRSRFGTFSGQFYLDDIQFGSNCNPAVLCKKPPSGGWVISVEGVPFVGDQRLFASYTLMSNLSYRTYEQPWTDYTSYGIGLGQGYTDFDLWKLGVDLAVVPQVPLKVYGAFSRQGQGDYRIPFPVPDSFPVTPTFLSGVVQYVYRGAVSGAVSLAWLDVSGDVGVNHEVNYQHVPGIHHTSIAGRVQFSLVWARIFGGTIRAPAKEKDSPTRGDKPGD